MLENNLSLSLSCVCVRVLLPESVTYINVHRRSKLCTIKSVQRFNLKLDLVVLRYIETVVLTFERVFNHFLL